MHLPLEDPVISFSEQQSSRRPPKKFLKNVLLGTKKMSNILLFKTSAGQRTFCHRTVHPMEQYR